MALNFPDWLRKSNEAKPWRDAFELCDQMPDCARPAATEAVYQAMEKAWQQTKHDLGAT